MLRKIIDFLLFSHLFIATCAVLMVYQCTLLLGTTIEFSFYCFVFFGSLSSYNFHSLLSTAGRQPFYRLPIFFGASAASIYFASYHLSHLGWLAITGFMVFLYSAPKLRHPVFVRLRNIAVAKTIYLAAAWAHITALLPFIVANEPLQAVHIVYLVNRFLFIYSICIVFDLRDRHADKKAGIKSLITWMSDKGIDKLFWATLLLCLVTNALLLKWFSLMSVISLVIPALIMCFLYKRAKVSTSKYLYYFLLDGLMALSAPILILAKFAR